MVSVLINNYNYGRFIGEAIKSVLNQTYQEFELIIVDGNSKDNSREVIMNYCNKYPDKITAVFKTTSGQAAAFNVGFKLSKGNIIAFLDSDDYWFENKLERIVELHKKYEFIGHAKQFSNGQEDIVSTYMEHRRPELFKKYGFSHTYYLTTSSISAKRELLEKILPMPEEEYLVFADHYVKLGALYYSNIKYIDEKLMYYRIHTNNAFTGNEQYKYASFRKKLDKMSIDKLNKELREKELPIIPTPTLNLYREALKIVGDGFEIQNKKYVLYGTGKKAEKTDCYIRECGGETIYYCDSDKEKWGKSKNGVLIISPNELVFKRNEYEKIIIGSVFYKEISRTLENLGLYRGKDYMYTEVFPYY